MRKRLHFGKKLVCVLAVAAVLCGAAAAASGTVTARLQPDVTVVIDGSARTFYNVQGQEVHPIGYDGTTYVPIRSIGELMDRNVNWDASTLTATIGGARTTPDATGTPDTGAAPRDISVRLHPDYTIVIDGTARTFRDVNGRTVSPLLYNGSIYLPIRAIGEIMGKTVSWDGATDTVTLGAAGDDQVTDFDTSGTAGGQTGSQSGSVTLEEAKAAALADAGVTAGQATFVRAQLDWDDGRQVYDVEFIVTSGSTVVEYDYEISASTGRILSADRDAEYYRPSTGGTAVTEAEAIETVLAKVPGASSSDVRIHLDYDDGRAEYEGTIVYNRLVYEFTVDASTGRIVDWEVESIYD